MTSSKSLFFQKMRGYLRDMVNPKDYKEKYDLTQHFNEVWEKRGAEADTA
jgi:hypothetical protein